MSNWWRRAATSFVAGLVVIIGLHWILLQYAQPYGGQQSDDDYHYYGFAARLDARESDSLPGLRSAVVPDRAELYDRSRLAITYSAWVPYPAWSYVVHLGTRIGLSYQGAALVLFALQTGMLLVGSLLLWSVLAGADRQAWWWQLAAALSVAAFWGAGTFPSLLLSLPINMAVSLCLAAFALLLVGRVRVAAALLVAAALTHVASLVLVLYVIAGWAAYGLLDSRNGVLRTAAILASVLATVWAVTYVWWQGMSSTGIDDQLALGFDLRRIRYVIAGNRWFLPLLGGAAALGAVALRLAGRAEWKVAGGALLPSVPVLAAFVLIESRHADHPTLHPVGRALYLLPPLFTLVAAASAAVTLRWSRSRPALVIATLVAAIWTASIVSYDRAIVADQFSTRPQKALGPLYRRLAVFANDPELPRTTFVFYNHEYGTVLSPAHLYYGRYLWAKVYSPERLREAAQSSSRLIYVEGPGDPRLRVSGFCPVSAEELRLGTDPRDQRGDVVRLVEAHRCPEESKTEFF